MATVDVDEQISQLLDAEDEFTRAAQLAARQREVADERAQRHAVKREALTRIRELNTEIERLGKRRAAAASGVEHARHNPMIGRFERSQAIANAAGVGHAWQTVREWLVSNRPRTQAPPQAIPMLVPQDQVPSFLRCDWPDELRFNDADRTTILEYVRLCDEARRVNAEYTQRVQERDTLLMRFPELRDLQ